MVSTTNRFRFVAAHEDLSGVPPLDYVDKPMFEHYVKAAFFLPDYPSVSPLFAALILQFEKVFHQIWGHIQNLYTAGHTVLFHRYYR